jgi:hypothetical protein
MFPLVSPAPPNTEHRSSGVMGSSTADAMIAEKWGPGYNKPRGQANEPMHLHGHGGRVAPKHVQGNTDNPNRDNTGTAQPWW